MRVVSGRDKIIGGTKRTYSSEKNEIGTKNSEGSR